MKKIILLILLSINYFTFSQNNKQPELPFIEVTGTAKREIEPNLIYISITLTEKSIDNKKFSIEAQEKELQKILVELNIPFSKLTLADYNSTILTVKRKEIGFKQSKQFILILETAKQVSDLFEKLFNANLKEADVFKIDHTDIVKFNKEVRIEAIKAAKDKAEYITNAVGNKIDKPLEIIELGATDMNYYRGNLNTFYSQNVEVNSSSSEFKKILITFSFKVKYQIQ
jgi:uncharacterized protein YggE